MVTLIFSSQSKMVQAALKKALNSEHPDRNEYNFISFDMGVTSIEELVNECETHSLCMDKKAVVAENCYFLDKIGETKKKKKDPSTELLLKYLSNDDESTDLYLLLYADVLDYSNPIIQIIKDKHRIQEIAKLSDSEWISYYCKNFQKEGYSIDQEAAEELYKRISGDYSTFLNESAKLKAFKLDDKTITFEDVCNVIAPKLEDDSIKICNYLTSGDIASAIKIYKDLKTHSNDEMMLIGMLTTQFIFYDKVKYLDSKGYDVDQIAQTLNQKNSKRIYMTLKNLRKLSSVSISRILNQLYEAESSILSGTVSQEFAFSKFLANFSL